MIILRIVNNMKIKKNETIKFTIRGLYGIHNCDLDFWDNRLILVGENGTKKTTCLKLFYYFITKQFSKLLLYDFLSIELVLSNSQKITANKESIPNSAKIINHL